MTVQAIMHLTGVVDYGYIIIRFEAGRPTLIERHENIRLTGDNPRV